jgi:hypothetical protein
MSVKETIQRQSIIGTETYQYLKRDFKKYSTGALGMWALFGRNFEQGDAFRSIYYLFRNVDDIMDGDRQINEDPFTYTDRLRNNIVNRNFNTTSDPILHLAKRSMDHFDKVKKPDDNPQEDMLQLIDAMVEDRHRMLHRQALPQEALTEEYRTQFYPIQNLQLIALESKIRVDDIPDFPIVQGRVYALKDLQNDWEKGLINIPLEVLTAAGLDSDADFPTVRDNPVIQQWVINECIECGELLDIENQRLADGLHGKQNKIPRLIFEHLTDTLAKFIYKTVSTDESREEENALHKPENLFTASAIGEALRMNSHYRRQLQIKPTELVRYTTKSTNLAACYAGFSQHGTHNEAVGAGKAAFLSCAYDVISDWNKSSYLRGALEGILDAEVSPELKSMALELLDRDMAGHLQHDGLERGVVALRFVLELMGLQENFETKTDVDKLGIDLQIIDDVLDYESDIPVGDTNCLTSNNRTTYLKQVVDAFSDESIQNLFPHAGVLGFAIRKARNKAQQMLSSPNANFK